MRVVLLSIAVSLMLSCTSDVSPDGSRSYTVVTQQIGFAKRTGERMMNRDISPGLDIDGRVSNRADDMGCNKIDFVNEDGTEGIDNNFSFLFEAVEGLFEAGTVEALIQEAVREGRLLLMFRLEGVDSLENDEEVTLRLFSGSGDPADQGGLIVSDQTFDIKEGAPVSVASGSIVDGVLEAGPVEVTVPVAILNVFFDLTVTNATVRGRVDEAGDWELTIGGGVPTEVIFEVAAMADAMQGDQISPLLEAFIPMWVDLEPNAEGECEAISANLLLRTTNAFLYPDATFPDEVD